jgi:hypothetical protein
MPLNGGHSTSADHTLPDDLKTPGHCRAEAETYRRIAEVQSHLRERGVIVEDRDVWQYGVANGPFADDEEWAGAILAELAKPDSCMTCGCARCVAARGQKGPSDG